MDGEDEGEGEVVGDGIESTTKLLVGRAPLLPGCRPRIWRRGGRRVRRRAEKRRGRRGKILQLPYWFSPVAPGGTVKRKRAVGDEQELEDGE